MKEITREELKVGQRITFKTIGYGYGYRLITKTFTGTFFAHGQVANGIWVVLDGKEKATPFHNLWGIWEA